MATVIDRLNTAEQTIDKLTDVIGAVLPQVQAAKALYGIIKQLAGEVGVNVGNFDEEIAKFDDAAARADAVYQEYKALRAQQTPTTPAVPVGQ